MMLERSCVTLESIGDTLCGVNVWCVCYSACAIECAGGSRGVVVVAYLIDLVLVDNETRELVRQVVLSRAKDVIPAR